MSAGSDRLERTRLAILEHVHLKEQRRHRGPPHADVAPDASANGDGARAGAYRPRPHRRGPGGWMDQLRDAIDGWWRYHPAHMAVDLARPVLSTYANRKPVQYLGIAAAAGAVLLLLRPWKLISATGVLVALVKSPHVASLVMSALATSHNPRDDEADAA